MANNHAEMQFKQDIASVHFYIRKKENVERICYILCNDNETYKIQTVDQISKKRFTLAQSKYKTTALKMFAEIFTNDIKEFTMLSTSQI